MCVRETHNTQDRYAVAVKKSQIVGTYHEKYQECALFSFTSLFANAIACDGIAAISGPVESGSPSFLLK